MQKEIKSCVVCGRTFETRSKSPNREKFCGDRCYGKFWNERLRDRKRANRKPVAERICESCGKAFTPDSSHPWAKTCSRPCGLARACQIRDTERAEQRDLSSRACPECGREFVPNLYAWKVQKYCSTSCARRVATRKYEGKNPKKGTDRARRRRYDGNWQLVLDRDGHRCQICGSTEKLTVHHWDGTGKDEEPNHDLENLMTTCTSCHGKLHHVKVRVLAGEVYVVGEVFDLLRVDSVKVLRREKQ